jgi:hypothetical protein
MSNPSVHWVKPNLPHQLSEIDSLPVVGLDLLLVPASPFLSHCRKRHIDIDIKLDVSWVFPGPIDVEKLKIALAKTLHDYPHGAGRLSYDEQCGRWLIRLTNDAVPIIMGTTDLIFDEELMQIPHPDIIESTPFVFQRAPLVDSPLVKLKLVEWHNCEATSLSLSFHHSLGEF